VTSLAALPGARTASRPTGLTAFRVIVASTYVIYIAVSFFKSENFLFLLDALLAVAVVFAITSRAFAERTIAHGYLMLTLAVYVAFVLFAWVALSAPTELAALKTLRNLLYCVGVFIVAITYVTDRTRLGALLSLMVVLTILSALYGLRQAVFGYWQFELDRLALMGSSLKEMIVIGRVRLTATFGDPLLCGFFMMCGLFFMRARWNMERPGRAMRLFYRIGAIAVFGVLVASLTRAPLLGLAVGFVAILIIDFRLDRRSLGRIGLAVLAGILFVGAVVWVVQSRMLEESENPALRFLDAGLTSVWSLIAMFLGGGDETTYFLVNQSRDARLNAWTNAFAYLMSNPLGAGFSEVFNFSLGDTGLLQVAMLTGIPGLLAFLSVAALVFFRGFAHLRRSRRIEDRRAISALLGLWIAIFVTTAISSLATSSVAAVLIWLVGGALVNVSRIFPVERGT